MSFFHYLHQQILAQDQYRVLYSLCEKINIKTGGSLCPMVLDGDTPFVERNNIRNIANILLTNPDMIHCSLLSQVFDFFKSFGLSIVRDIQQ